MSDKKELKNDEIVESSNKSDEKLVSRAASGRLNVINNASQPIIIYEEYDYPNGYTVQPNSTTLIQFSVDGTDVSFGAGVSNAVISGTYKRDNNPLYEFTNEKTVQIWHGVEDILTITSVELLPSPILYLNESYSVPNFVDPEPPEIYVWVKNVRLMENVLFTDSSNNIITPTESEVVSTISSNEHIFSFTFALNAPISKIFIAGYDQSAAANEAQRYENTDFTGFLMSSYNNAGGMTYGGKSYNGYTLPSGTKSFKLTSWMY